MPSAQVPKSPSGLARLRLTVGLEHWTFHHLQAFLEQMAGNAWLSRLVGELVMRLHLGWTAACTGPRLAGRGWGRAVTGTGRQATSRPLTPRPLLRPLQLDTHGTRPACNAWHLTSCCTMTFQMITAQCAQCTVGRFTKSFHCIVWVKHMISPGIFCMCGQSHQAC